MGGRSRSSSSTQSTQGGMTNGAHKVSNGAVAGMQQDLKNSQMSDVVGGFGALLQDAKSMFGQNTMMNMMGGMLGMPIQLETPDAMTDFINKYKKPDTSAYDQRISALMESKGMTREEAAANQAYALQLGTDYNNDGAVGNDEWDKYQQGQYGAQPQRQQPFNVNQYMRNQFTGR